MTIEKAQKDFMELIEKNRFTEAARTTDTNNIVYYRVWNNDNETLKVRIMFSHTCTLVTVRYNGNNDPKFIRDYASPKRAICAILNWLIEGYRLIIKEGLQPPKAVREAVEEYRKDSDKISRFTEECLEAIEGAEVRCLARLPLPYHERAR